MLMRLYFYVLSLLSLMGSSYVFPPRVSYSSSCQKRAFREAQRQYIANMVGMKRFHLSVTSSKPSKYEEFVEMEIDLGEEDYGDDYDDNEDIFHKKVSVEGEQIHEEARSPFNKE